MTQIKDNSKLNDNSGPGNQQPGAVADQHPAGQQQPAATDAALEEEVKLITKNEEGAIGTMTVDLTKGNELPDLETAEIVPFDLTSQYWTPEKEGEAKKVYFLKIATRPVQDQEDKEVVRDLPCAFFLEKINGEMQTICNGSIRLVSALENNKITRGTPLLVTYLGKKKNSTNAFKSDQWKINPLVINLQPAAE